jgi:hypothetical protein
MKGFAEFEFDLAGALLSQVVNVLDNMESELLTTALVAEIPSEAQGVYQLFLDDQMVYIGKTDAEAGLSARLQRHAKKILHRRNFGKKKVSFRAVRISVFAAMDLETQLIKHYKGKGQLLVAWNNSGFGANDPGRNRETTNKHPLGFDSTYPIDIDIPLGIKRGSHPVSEVLIKLKDMLPYCLRYEVEGKAGGQAFRTSPHADQIKSVVSISKAKMTAREIITEIVRALPSGWQATAFVSHIILYKESVTYTHGDILATSTTT